MTTSLIVAGLFASYAAAYPSLAVEKRDPVNPFINPNPGWSPSQLIDVTGEHAFVAPGPNDLRGPCPGLNALANHGYLPHNGVATITQFISATNSGKTKRTISDVVTITKPPDSLWHGSRPRCFPRRVRRCLRW